MTTRSAPRRHWFSYGTDPLPTGDVLRDQDPIQAQRIADLFNSPAKADDASGGRVLRGLTATETDDLERMWRHESAGHDIDRARFLELLRKHELRVQ